LSIHDAALLLIAAAVFDWIATVVMFLAERDYPNAALRERVVAAVILSGISTIGAIMSLAFLGGIKLPGDVVSVLLVGGFLLASMPEVVWLYSLLTGRFR
jgi:hypothetical protein